MARVLQETMIPGIMARQRIASIAEHCDHLSRRVESGAVCRPAAVRESVQHRPDLSEGYFIVTGSAVEPST